MARARPLDDVLAVLRLKDEGRTDRNVSRLTGVPINTIRLWRNRGISKRAARALDPPALCPTCRCDEHNYAALPGDAYAYLLGVYLGDGYLGRFGAAWTLRIVLDERYPAIVDACCRAIEELRDGQRPLTRPDYGGSRCIRIESTWRQWPCLLPQHGPGRKHSRKIELVQWQQEILDRTPEAFLRGLIHTDGWRGVNRVHVKGKDYEYPRYQFSNRSDDIRRLFTDACDKIGVKWRPWTRHHVSVAQRESVALLDTFIGPKR